MMLGETIAVALIALRANKLRSVLTMLGIVIGVAAVIAMVALGRGAQQAVNDRITALGTTLLIGGARARCHAAASVSSSDRAKLHDGRRQGARRRRARSSRRWSPRWRAQLQVQWRRTNTNTTIIGTTANYPDVRKYNVPTGRMFTTQEDDGRKRVAVLGATMANNLALGAPGALVGENIRISGIQFQVIGMLRAQGRRGLRRSRRPGPDPDQHGALSRVRHDLPAHDQRRWRPSEAMIPETMAEIERILRRQHRHPPAAATTISRSAARPTS